MNARELQDRVIEEGISRVMAAGASYVDVRYHPEDVSESLAAAARGKQTGIAVSHSAIGEGVNAANIRRVLEILRDAGYTGVLSMECEGGGGPMIERSLAWLRRTLRELGIPEEKD